LKRDSYFTITSRIEFFLYRYFEKLSIR